MKANNLRAVLIALLPIVLILLILGLLAGEVLIFKEVKLLESKRPQVTKEVVQVMVTPSPSASPSATPHVLLKK